jgi:hypothetical protein
VLEKTQLPVYALGVGGQAPSGGDYRLTGDNLRFWRIVSERSRLIGVRGRFTADLLSSNGIRNLEIVGCPSLFRTRERALTITAPAEIRRVAFSVRREVDRDYAARPGDYLRFQREFLLQAAATFDITVTTHGELEEKAFHFRNEPAMAEAREVFRREGWFTPETATRMEALYREKLAFFLRVEDYDAFIRTQDFAIGYRVHGVLPALANGVAGFLVRYDSRSAELADTFGIPSMGAGRRAAERYRGPAARRLVRGFQQALPAALRPDALCPRSQWPGAPSPEAWMRRRRSLPGALDRGCGASLGREG